MEKESAWTKTLYTVHTTPGRKKRTYWASKRTQLPIQNTDNPILRRVEYQVVELVVSMYDAQAHLRLVWQVIFVPPYHFIEIRDRAGFVVGFNIDGLGLQRRHARECFDLAGKVGR